MGFWGFEKLGKKTKFLIFMLFFGVRCLEVSISRFLVKTVFFFFHSDFFEIKIEGFRKVLGLFDYRGSLQKSRSGALFNNFSQTSYFLFLSSSRP